MRVEGIRFNMGGRNGTGSRAAGALSRLGPGASELREPAVRVPVAPAGWLSSE